MRYFSIHIVAVSLLLLMFSSSVSSGAINDPHVGVSNGDEFTLEVVQLSGLLTEYEDEVLTMGDYSLWANESVTIKVTDTTLVNDSVTADVTIHSGTHETLIPLGIFGSPIVHTNWGTWAADIVTLKNSAQDLIDEINESGELDIDLPTLTFDVDLDQGEQLVTALLTGVDDAGSQFSLDISYKKETGVLNQVVLNAVMKTDFIDLRAGAVIQNTDFIEPSEDDNGNAPGFEFLLAFTSLLVLVPLLRRKNNYFQ